MSKIFKTSVMLLALVLVSSNTVHAQLYEVSGLYGYQLGGKSFYSGGNLRMDDGAAYSANFGINVKTGVTVELTYASMSSELFIQDNLFVPREAKISDIKAEWFHIGVLRSKNNGQARPYGGLSMGMTVFSPSNPNLEVVEDRNLKSTEKFSFILKGGMKYMFTENIGMRVQAELMVPVQWGGLYIGVGSGGTSTGASVGSSTIFGAFSGGLVFAFGDA